VSAKYLLPCPCGRQTVVESRQAGETTTCACGASLQIPTLLHIATLEPAPDVSPPATYSPTWGLKQSLRFMGITLAILGIIFAASDFFLGRPVSRFDMIDPEQLIESAQKFTPVQTWQVWGSMKQGLDRRIDQKYADDLQKFYLREAFFGTMTLIGVALVVAGTIKIRI
jgi:hypothetical protein